MLVACDQGTVELWMLRRVVRMSDSVNTGLSFETRFLYIDKLLSGTRILTNVGYAAFAFASLGQDLAGEGLWLVESATRLV